MSNNDFETPIEDNELDTDNLDLNDSTDIIEDDLPNNDFEDDLSFEDENAFLDDEQDNFSDVQTTSSSGMNWFNIGIIAFVVIAIGGILYLFLPNILGNNGQTPSTQQPMQMAQAEQSNKSETTPQDDGQPMGLLQNPDLIMTEDDLRAIESQIIENDNSRVFDALNPPTNISSEGLFDAVRGRGNASETDFEPTQGFAEVPQFVPNPPESVTDDAFDTLPMPSDTDITNLDDQNFDPLFDTTEDAITENDITETQPIEPTAMPEVMTVTDTAPLSSSDVTTNDTGMMNERLDTLEQSLNMVMNRLDNLPVSSNSSSNNAEIQSLRDTIATLDNKIASLNTQIQANQSQPKISTPAPTPEKVEKATEPKKAKPAPKKAAPRPVAPRVQYDLRGVANGVAYIARKGTENLQTITVGSSVQGLGRITSIDQNNGRWIVKGTSGSVRQ